MEDLLIDEKKKTEYVPSSREIKIVILCYLFVGIFVVLQRKEQGEYIEYHLRQALGRWIVFIVFTLVSIVLLMIPWIRIIPLLGYILLVFLWGYMVYEGWKMLYGVKKSVIGLFYGIGDRFVGILY